MEDSKKPHRWLLKDLTDILESIAEENSLGKKETFPEAHTIEYKKKVGYNKEKHEPVFMGCKRTEKYEWTVFNHKDVLILDHHPLENTFRVSVEGYSDSASDYIGAVSLFKEMISYIR